MPGELSTGRGSTAGQRADPALSVLQVNRSRRLPAPLVTTLTTVVLAAAILAGTAVLAAPPAAARPADTRPTAVVALGDSVAAGEGAGDYEPGTRGEGGDWCHRSPGAYVNRTGLAERAVNLACSGAASADVRFGGRHDTEASQAERLVEVATRLRVTTVFVQLGANDDAALIDTLGACVRAFLDPTQGPCRNSLDPLVDARMAATAGKVEAAVADVRTAMRRAGYGDAAYQLVLVSYSSPVTEHMVGVPGLIGCPYTRPDGGWGRTVLIPKLSAALAGVAERTGARFVDMSRAAEGAEACSHDDPRAEWQRRLTVSPDVFAHGGGGAAGYHLAQESFHPSATAYGEFGRCLGEFVRTPQPSAACVPVAGHLQVRGRALAPAA
jgi:lysophospholipase L1-like esterase